MTPKSDGRFPVDGKRLIAIIVFSLGMGILLQYYICLAQIMQVKEGSAVLRAFVRLVLLSPWTYAIGVALGVLQYICARYPQIGRFCYRFRYAFAAAAWIVLTVCGINGSSAGYWCELTGTIDTGLLAGYSRIVRSDEYAVATPSFFAQVMSGADDAFSYFSTAINGSEADLFLGIRQPILHILTIFRPFLAGYLVLPAENALAFYWCGRLILLCCLSYEFGMMITKKRRDLSVIFAMLVAFAPPLQWWYTGTVIDLTITAFGALLLFRYVLTQSNLRLRCLGYAGIFWCAGCFILCLYPSWQVPYVYIILIFIAWILIMNRDRIQLKAVDLIPILSGVALLATAIVYVAVFSADTFSLITGTVYPGERAETGGGEGSLLFTYGVDFLFAMTNKGFGTNICESATVPDFFPLPLVLSFYILAMKKDRKDLLLILCLAVDIFFTLWVVAGFPGWLAKLTLLSNSQPARTKVILGILNLILLFRSISLLPEKESRSDDKLLIIITGISMLAAMIIAFGRTVSEYALYMPVFLFAAMLLVSYALLFGVACAVLFAKRNALIGRIAISGVILVAMANGVLVNPIRHGMDSVYKIPLLQEIAAADERTDHELVFVMENTNLPAVPYSDAGLWVGAKMMNATAIYPNMTMWHTIDPEGKYEQVYNRYAHINIVIKETGEPEFTLVSEDTICVTLRLDDLQYLGVNGIISDRDLKQYDTSENYLSLERLNDASDIYIYRIHLLNGL